MPVRLLNSVLFASIFAIGVSFAQEGTAEVPVPGNVYAQIMACGAGDQAFLPIGVEHSVVRVSMDGSSLTFKLPGRAYPTAVAPYRGGVNVLGRWPDNKFVIYHFDNLGNLLTQHSVPIDLNEKMMATTSSGTTILVGHHRASQDDEPKYGGVVLDAEDRVVSRFELPTPPAGGTWTIGRLLMTAGDGAAYALLRSNEPPTTMIATISETGKLHVKTIPEPVLGETRGGTTWLVGQGVAVEKYHLDGDPTLIGGVPAFRFDEYDLKTGQKIASKTAPMGSAMPFSAACYYGDSVTGLGARMQVMPDEPYLRLRIARLQ